ncbi:MAG: 50S ribosomal protein L20 [Candidatus Kerfeldbacteria bacterium RIFOXYA2_FULL_38_24]|uniref:Large ribosomal subunit protein bL20 n=1 Tax=Candidatus Kerfeldbacteria bacterium RIFOXYB2_FULL_38_14 TaxID=1798547 RepID=A0A1G2BC98_9BACT|nr:MAG: 50S ribosomal protein L20 [Candidatus Kerfeldbacteria bacterium RIFOXYA2_FULL_38_24]OGY86336.1 MAG: 50S ribosomal protein L20 [Candidatus Kerfeldbacteria bacterium RIFOXYB2_FULL_38_14]OGY88434.1 MAG: 50S ribosomal protein L20 [Candidatus Kerfeldbacteria bacterium RIFOXYC2_FULL_38_9]
MARIKRGSERTKKRGNLLKRAKGFYAGRKNSTRLAKQATKKAGQRAFDDRKLKKRDFRALWQIKISAATKAQGLSYSAFMGALKKEKIELDRKILSQLAEYNPEIFSQIIAKVKK